MNKSGRGNAINIIGRWIIEVKNVIIADITGLHKNKNSFGHFFRVAKMFEEGLCHDCNVTIVGGPVYRGYSGNKEILKYDVDLRELQTTVGKVKAKIKEVFNGIAVLRKYKKSTIIFQDYSNTSMFLSICMQKSNSAIYIIQYKSEIDKGVNSFLYRIARRRISGVLCTKNAVGEKYGIPYLTMPDYICTDTDGSKKLDLNNEYRYEFGIFGIIRDGKDVVGVAKKFVGIKRTLLIAGSIQELNMKKSLEKLAEENENIIVLDQYLSEEDYNNMISATRCIVLPYVDEYYNESSSGVVYDALFAKKPVITKKYEIFDFIRQYKIGVLYDNLDDVDFSVVMREKEFLECYKNIEKYLSDNRAYILKLKNFIGNGMKP